LTGDDLYCQGKPLPGDLDCYRYSPLTAALLTPLTFVPDNVGGVLWRLLNAGVLTGSLFWCCRAVFPNSLAPGQRALLFLLVLPLALGNFNNGQANPLVLGLVLATLAAAAERRWNVAAVCMALACLLKLYPIAVGLLVVLLYPRQFASRLTTALAVGLILPFLMQHRDYVAVQYAKWASAVAGDDRHDFPLAACYRDFQLLCRLWLAPLSPLVYRIVEIAAGTGIAGLCLIGKCKQWTETRLLGFVLGTGCCWMTAFGPATESCTYVLIAPCLAYLLVETWTSPRSGWLRGLLAVNYSLFIVANMEAWFPGGGLFRSHGLQPLSSLLLLVNIFLVHFVESPCDTAGGHSLAVSAARAA
jgi:hypothetical protein